MKEQFVTYEIALKLKELGFDEECFGWYNYGELVLFKDDNLLDSYAGEDNRPEAPLWQQVIDWLRIEHNYNLLINANSITSYAPMVNKLDEDSCLISVIPYKNYKVWEEAREQAILKAIELIKQSY